MQICLKNIHKAIKYDILKCIKNVIILYTFNIQNTFYKVGTHFHNN